MQRFAGIAGLLSSKSKDDVQGSAEIVGIDWHQQRKDQ